MLESFGLKFSFCKIWWSFWVCLVSLRQVYTCPKVCDCGILDDKKYVQCDQVDFTVLSKEIPSDTELLYLSSTKITTLTENFFSALSNLHTIEFTNNQIENIPSGVFNGLSKLVRLILQNNGIQRVEENAFSELSTLKQLSLSNNRLSILPQNLITDLASLERLNLDKNNLHTIPSGFFNNTVKLKTLKLNNNNLTAIDDRLLQRLSNLEILDLSTNQITEIEDNAFDTPGATLYSISLNGNKLSSFPETIYDLQVPPKYFALLLQDNGMTAIPQEAQAVFDKIQTGRIRLSENPYICDSSIRWLQTWLRTHRSLVVDVDDISCETMDGSQAKLTEFNFNKTVTSISPTPSTAAQTPTSSHSYATSSLLATSYTTLRVTSSYALLASSSTTLLSTSPTSSARPSTTLVAIATTMTSYKASSYTSLPTSSAVSITTSSTKEAHTQSPTLTLIFSTSRTDTTTARPTEVRPTTSNGFSKVSEVITVSPDVRSTQQIPEKTSTLTSTPSLTSTLISSTSSSLSLSTSPQPSPSLITNMFSSHSTNSTISILINPTTSGGKVNTSIMIRREHIILATCLSAAFILIVLFIAMFCFRKKFIKRDKISNTGYDKVRIV